MAEKFYQPRLDASSRCGFHFLELAFFSRDNSALIDPNRCKLPFERFSNEPADFTNQSPRNQQGSPDPRVWGGTGVSPNAPEPVLGDSDAEFSLETVLRKQMEEFRTCSLAQNTVRGYECDWRDFEAWCERQERSALPAIADTSTARVLVVSIHVEPRKNRRRGKVHMERRAVLKILGVGSILPRLRAFAVATNCQEHGIALAQINAQPPQYRLQFFTPEENELVDQLAELIIPADEHSPGAQAAKVSLFADLMLATGDKQAREQWRNGLRVIQQEAGKSSLAAVLAMAAATEADPKTELEHFFASLKEMTIVGYYTSSIGIHQDLGYRGNSFLTSFPGCTHPEHQT